MLDSNSEILDYASQVLLEEAEAVNKIRQFLNEDFVKSVETILHSNGRLIVTGIGKSAIIGQKIVATLNSTGTPCLVVEMGVGMRITKEYGEQLTDGIFNLMKQMGMWNGDIDLSSPKTEDLVSSIVCKGDHVAFLNAECSGVFLTELRTGLNVTEGQTIGQIVNPLTGEVLSEVKSPVDGFLFTIRAYPIVNEGSLMARIYHA